MDGTSGALYSIFFNALTSYFRTEGRPGQTAGIDFTTSALQAALKTLGRYTSARVGDRTVMDALIPYVEVLASSRDLKTAAQAAVDGAESTKRLLPRLGRTVYIGRQEEWLGKVPDPGAWGLSSFLAGLAA